MSDFPALENFLAAYFHQDWAMEHDTPAAVAEYYRSSESPALVEATRADLDRLLAQELDEASLADIARRLGSEYDPTRDGTTWRDWLERLREQFTRV